MSDKKETKTSKNDSRDSDLDIFDILHLSAKTVDGYSPGYAITTAGSISSSKGSSSKCEADIGKKITHSRCYSCQKNY